MSQIFVTNNNTFEHFDAGFSVAASGNHGIGERSVHGKARLPKEQGFFSERSASEKRAVAWVVGEPCAQRFRWRFQQDDANGARRAGGLQERARRRRSGRSASKGDHGTGRGFTGKNVLQRGAFRRPECRLTNRTKHCRD